MRKLLYGAAAAVCIGAAGPAMANGSMKDVVVVEPTPIWSGCYMGVNIGGAWTDESDVNNVKKSHNYYESKEKAYEDYEYYKNVGKETYKSGNYGYDFWREVKDFSFDGNDDSTLFGGAHIGCNWQADRFGYGNLVYGVEADIGFGNDIEYLGSLRARLGTAWDSSLLYLTGGVAFANFDNDVHFYHEHNDVKWYGSTSGDPKYDYTVDRHFDNDDDQTGFVIGAGWEYLYKPNWSFGVEGLYYWFDEDNGTHKWVDGKDDSYHAYKFDRDTERDVFVVRVRMNYHIRRQPEPLK